MPSGNKSAIAVMTALLALDVFLCMATDFRVSGSEKCF